MDFFLVFLLGLGVGALALSVAARRRAEHPPPPQRADAAAAEVAASEAAAACEEQFASPEAAAPAEPAEISQPALQAPSNRRKHPRIRSDQSFVITPFAGRPLMAQCCDVSMGGMRFGVVGYTLRAGDLVRVTFNIGAETVSAIGSVMRVRELDPITSDVSLEFVRLDPWASQLLEQALEAEAEA